MPECYRDWEENMANLTMRPFPALTARRGHLARKRIHAAFLGFFSSEEDRKNPAVAGIIRGRADVFRSHGFTGREIASIESITAIVTVTNSAPTIFWLICFVYARPELMTRVRKEVTSFVRRESLSGPDGPKDVTIIDITRIEAQCPLLLSCYHETLRLTSYNVNLRRMATDATFTDSNGNSFLLKEGVDVQIPSGIIHQLGTIWEKPTEFDPERFLATGKSSQGSNASEKAKKGAYIPFGGGLHLCPGRVFAYTEILAIASTLLAGFELESTGIAFQDVKAQPPMLNSSIVKPENEGHGLGMSLSRRSGWEKTEWAYVSS